MLLGTFVAHASNLTMIISLLTMVNPSLSLFSLSLSDQNAAKTRSLSKRNANRTATRLPRGSVGVDTRAVVPPSSATSIHVSPSSIANLEPKEGELVFSATYMLKKTLIPFILYRPARWCILVTFTIIATLAGISIPYMNVETDLTTLVPDG